MICMYSSLCRLSSQLKAIAIEDFSATDEEKDDAPEEETATLALDISVKFLSSSKPKKGAGAPQKKSGTTRRCVEFGPAQTFKEFKRSVCTVLQRMDIKFDIGNIHFDDIDFEVKIPKGPAKWKKPLAVATDTQFKSFRTVLFATNDKYAESAIMLQEIEAENELEDGDGDTDSDVQLATTADRKRAAASSSSAGTKKKAKANTTAAIAPPFSPHKETLKEIEDRYECKTASCNPGGHCLIQDGRHIKLTKRKKQRFVASVVDACTHTVAKPPSVLFENSPPARGLGGSKLREPATPTRAGTYTEDLTITISSSSSSTPQIISRRERRTTISSFPPGSADNGVDELKATVTIPEFDPLTPGPILLIADAARLLHLHEDTIHALKNAGFQRVGQLARAYKNNFKRLINETKLTTSKLADVEELLLHWLGLQRPMGGGMDAGAGMFRDPLYMYGAAGNNFGANPFDPVEPPFSPQLPAYRPASDAPVASSSTSGTRPDS
ncbi:unnamed protein product [Tilletia caries]|uniref:Uncharacterized protein n=1 Tax=Tilletia caries TaxID=13290 RepID=A0ABN7J4X4_9BASI|nr:unnamed protein product [Tilletia caries]